MSRIIEDNEIITTAHEALALSNRRRRIAEIILRAPREAVEAVENAMSAWARSDDNDKP